MSNSRLHFIDVTRSLAIILMLQGHFISTTYVDYTEKTALLRKTGESGNFAFDIWCQFRGYTPPLFFTITGLVFAFLLTKNQGEDFWKQKRVRKGIKRGITIIILGYLLQLSISNFDHYYSNGQMNARFYAFHVLQCIGLGLLSVLFLYWMSTLIKKIPFALILFISGLFTFLLTPYINSEAPIYYISHAPLILQNVFNGPNSIFPIFPWFGFIFFGGTIGVLLHRFQNKIELKGFAFYFTIIGVTISLTIYGLLYFLGNKWTENTFLNGNYWQFKHLAVVIIIMGLIMFLQTRVKFKAPFLLAIGQNTLVVYVLHVILLYGAIFGIGIKTYLDKSLSFSASIFGAILFILLFGFITKYQSWIIEKVKGIFH
jgi:uncharacterized membrane protein